VGSVGKFSNNKIGGVVSVLLLCFMTAKYVLQGTVRFVGIVLNVHRQWRRGPAASLRDRSRGPHSKVFPGGHAKRFTGIGLDTRSHTLIFTRGPTLSSDRTGMTFNTRIHRNNF
jgi:hypothetical protein